MLYIYSCYVTAFNYRLHSCAIKTSWLSVLITIAVIRVQYQDMRSSVKDHSGNMCRAFTWSLTAVVLHRTHHLHILMVNILGTSERMGRKVA